MKVNVATFWPKLLRSNKIFPEKWLNEHFWKKMDFSGGDISRVAYRLLLFNQIHCDVEVVLPCKVGE